MRDEGGEFLQALALVFLAFPAAVVARAWALSTLWAWFVVPLGVVPIGWAHSFGLAVTVGMLTNSGGSGRGGDRSAAKTVAAALLVPAFAVFFGWCALGFMS